MSALVNPWPVVYPSCPVCEEWSAKGADLARRANAELEAIAAGDEYADTAGIESEYRSGRSFRADHLRTHEMEEVS